MPAKPSLYAALMGDIVGSGAASSAKAVHRAFNKAIAEANESNAASIASPLTITLGDEFQGLLTGLAAAWRTAIELRLTLLSRAVSCRFVVGVVRLDTPVNSDRAWNMMGAGLSAARAKLNHRASPNAYRFSFPDDLAIELLMDAVGESLTHVELGWTDTQRDYFVRTRLMQQSPAEIAGSLDISASAIYKVLRTALAEFHDRQSRALRDALTIYDKRCGLT